VVIAAMGCVALGIYAAIFWNDVEASYYLHSFRRRPGYLAESLDRPQGSRARAVLLSYAGTAEGQEALLRVAMEWHPEGLAALEEADTEGFEIRVYPKRASWSLCIWGGGRMRSTLESLGPASRRGVRLSLFTGLAGLIPDWPLTRALPERPGITFALWSCEEGYKFSAERG